MRSDVQLDVHFQSRDFNWRWKSIDLDLPDLNKQYKNELYHRGINCLYVEDVIFLSTPLTNIYK